MGNDDINFGGDQSWINNLGGRSYMAGVSPWFFTVCSTQNCGVDARLTTSVISIMDPTLSTRTGFTELTTGSGRQDGSSSYRTETKSPLLRLSLGTITASPITLEPLMAFSLTRSLGQMGMIIKVIVRHHAPLAFL